MLLMCAAVLEARFLQTDPVGYKDQFNLYAYVGNDPINNIDPTGMTCTSSESNGRTHYTCRIDRVAIVRDGKVVSTREPTARENRRFEAFNRRYTATVNRPMSNPDRPARVAAVEGRSGSFETTAGKAGEALISRQFIYAAEGPRGVAMGTAGGPGVDGQEARTYVHPDGLRAGRAGIVHDGGLHGTREEFTGGLQTERYRLRDIEHQRQYNEAACRLLGGKSVIKLIALFAFILSSCAAHQPIGSQGAVPTASEEILYASSDLRHVTIFAPDGFHTGPVLEFMPQYPPHQCDISNQARAFNAPR